VLLLLSIILTASVLFPDATNEQVILGILAGGVVVAVIIALLTLALSQNGGNGKVSNDTVGSGISRNTWRMPPLDDLPPGKAVIPAKVWMVCCGSI